MSSAAVVQPGCASPLRLLATIFGLDQEAWINLGSLLKDWGKGEDALVAFDRALALDSAYVPAYHLRGLCKHGMGDHRGAQADFMRASFYDGQVKRSLNENNLPSLVLF